MKKLKFLTTVIAVGLILSSCSNNKTEEKSEASTEVQSESPKAAIVRPPKSEDVARKLLGKFDSKFADISRTMRETKHSMEENNTKMTETIIKNISDMIAEANELGTQLEAVTDKLSEDDFGLYERDKDRIREKETEFETLKQNK